MVRNILEQKSRRFGLFSKYFGQRANLQIPMRSRYDFELIGPLQAIEESAQVERGFHVSGMSRHLYSYSIA
jgi:hypothetical protein